MLRATICLLVIVCLVGCTTMQPIDVPPWQTAAPELHVGDKVRVVARDGKVYRIQITGLDRDGIRGRNDRGEGRLRYADLQSIEVEKVSGWKVAAWAVGGAAILLLIFGHAFAKAFAGG